MQPARRSFWKTIVARIRGHRSRSPAFYPGCSIYSRDDGTWLFPQNLCGGAGGGISVTVGPAIKLGANPKATELGEAALACTARSRFDEIAPGTNWSPPDFAREAGFRNHADLERGARYLSVHRNQDEVTVTAWAAEREGGYVPASGGERTCTHEAAAIGQLILDLLPVCIPRVPSKTRRTAGGAPKQPRTSNSNDPPRSFGYKMQWVAVPTSEVEALAGELGLRDLAPCSWADGINAAYDLQGVFIPPPLNGWTIAVGRHPEAGNREFVPLLEKLSERFGCAFYFGTHRIVGYQAWARAENGEVRRAFAFLGESGEFLLNVGHPTPEEVELKTGIEEIDHAPNEQTVLELAGKWVLDPREIGDRDDADGPGWFGSR